MKGFFAASGSRTFNLICSGQIVSAVGTGLTNFTLGVWVYQQTGSATKFALVALSGVVPGGIALLFGGVLADGWSRRGTMILSNAGAGAVTFVAAVLLFVGRLEVWHVYVGVMVRSLFAALIEPALASSTTLLVRKENYGRASGMMQSARATAQIVSPLLGGILMSYVQLGGVLLLDFVSYVFALGTLLVVNIPSAKPGASAGAGAKGSLKSRAVYGWTYIRERRGLLALLLYFTVINLVLGFATVLFTPMILGFTTARVLGMIMSAGGAGFLCGSVVMSAWGGPRNRVKGILWFGSLLGVCCILAGLKTSPVLIACAAFGMFFALPVINGCSQAIWQCKTPVELQGRVYAMRRIIAFSCVPVPLVVAGPLADRVFEPLVAGPLGVSLGAVIGRGPGRGIALMFIIAGSLTILTQLGAYLYPRLRLVEGELPDAVPDMTPSEV